MAKNNSLSLTKISLTPKACKVVCIAFTVLLLIGMVGAAEVNFRGDSGHGGGHGGSGQWGGDKTPGATDTPGTGGSDKPGQSDVPSGDGSEGKTETEGKDDRSETGSEGTDHR